MANYKLLIKLSAVKELEALPGNVRRRIVSRVRGLSEDPRPRGCEKLSGRGLYRLRQGKDRVVYEVIDDDRTVTVVKIGHRRDVYR